MLISQKYPSRFVLLILCLSAFLISDWVQAAEVSGEKRVRSEQREKMRGEMRQAWANMTPEEREALRREYPDYEDGWVLRARNGAEEVKPPRQAAVSNRPLSAEEHHHLRRQLRDLSQEERR